MDKLLGQIIERHSVKANPKIMDGLAVHYLEHSLEYLDKSFQATAANFPILPKGSIRYVGIERLSPYEEFLFETKSRNNKIVFDLAQSDLCLHKLKLEFDDGEKVEPIEVKFHILFNRKNEGGILYLGGSRFQISPVLMDKVVTASNNSIFVRLQQDKISFQRTQHNVRIDGVSTIKQLLWSAIYRPRSEKVPKTTKAVAVAVHYLLINFGIDKLFDHLGVDLIIDNEDSGDVYDKDTYTTFSSTKIKPATNIDQTYRGSKLRLIVKNDDMNPVIETIITGVFYLIDHFPERLTSRSVLNDKIIMKVLLGHIVFSGKYSEPWLLNSINDHIQSLENYIDDLVKTRLKQQFSGSGTGLSKVDDFYDMLLVLTECADSMIANQPVSTGSLGDKNYDVLYTVFYNITVAFNRFSYRLKTIASKKQIITARDISKTANDYIKPGLIYQLTRGNIAVSAVSYPGDNKFSKVTSNVALQPNVPGVTRAKKGRPTPNASMRVNPTMAQAGSLLNISKSTLTPAGRANPFTDIDLSSGAILMKPHLAELTESVQRKITIRPEIRDVDIIETDDEGKDS